MKTVLRVAGAMCLLGCFGSAQAQLGVSGNEYWHQDSNLIGGNAEAFDGFGVAVVTGDFNGDGHQDLAVGVPGEDVGAVQDGGLINIIYGGFAGLTSDNNRTFFQGQLGGIGETAEAGDRFGEVMVTGNFNGDAYDDLAIGIYSESLGAVQRVGMVTVIYGSSSGLTSSASQSFTQNDVGGVAAFSEAFGSSLAAADFGNDGFDDLIIGVPEEDFSGSFNNGGLVHEVPGSASGLNLASARAWHQDTALIEGTLEAGDAFGHALIAADFNNDGFADLAISAFAEDVGAIEDAGAVNVIFGRTGGLSADGNQIWTQDTPGIEDQAEFEDLWGWSLAAGDFDNDGFVDLVVGSRYESVGTVAKAGAVQVLYSDSGGVSTRDELWTAGSPGLGGTVSINDWFSYSLVTGDFNGDGHDDLAVGVLNGDTDNGVVLAGLVQVIYGNVGGLSSDNSQLWSQSTPGLPGVADQGDLFGISLASGYIDNDGFADLVIGAAGDNPSAEDNAGAVHVLFGAGGTIFADGFE